MTKQELIRNFENMDKNQLAEAAKRCFGNVVDEVNELTDNQEFAFQFGCSIIANVVAIDGVFDTDEFALFAYILGRNDLDYSSVKNFLQQYAQTDVLQSISKFLDKSSQLKLDACTLGFAVAAIDGNVSVDENKLLTYLID